MFIALAKHELMCEWLQAFSQSKFSEPAGAAFARRDLLRVQEGFPSQGVEQEEYNRQ